MSANIKRIMGIGIHKSVKSLKRDGVLLMLFDLVVLFVVVGQNRGIIFTVPALKSIVLDFIVYTIINTLWAIDSKNWIADERRRKLVWAYIFSGAVILLGIGLLTIIGQLMIASVLVYILAFYYAFGIWLIMRYI